MNDSNSDQEKKNRKLLNRFIAAGFVLMLTAAAFWAGFLAGGKGNVGNQQKIFPVSDTNFVNQESKNSELDFSLFWKAYELLKEKYVDSSSLDAKKLMFGAIEGLMRSTGDPYTVYLDPDENKKFSEDITGSFEGIGAEMGIKQDILTIIAPLEGSPAEKAGLRAGDKVIKINGENSSDLGLDEAVDKIRGPKGTEVKLTIWRNGDEEAKEITVARDIINVKSVKFIDKGDGIAYIKISRFGEDTDSEFNEVVKKNVGEATKGIILDLRNDPGGYLDGAVNIASKMLSKDKVVVIEESGDKKQKKLLSRGGDVLSHLPTVVLINEGSASASEILAGSLGENRDNVTLVGKKSFGKGSVQELIELPQETAAKITVARWLTPRGNQINEVGIEPNITIGMTEEDYANDRDPQLEKALEIIKDKIGK
jgi:carboxyl-terminal processing protease